MNEWAIVAIPHQDDYVWKISSEKIPHLTLIYLGSPSGGIREQWSKEIHIKEYLEHAASMTIRGFGLSVDRRGTLGDKNADVLFFSKRYGVPKLEEVRGHLLKNDEIFKMYHSAHQYPEWTPHLTLGYPKSPAKPDERDHPRFHFVEFDRIALWTGDYEGPEIVLKDYDEEQAMDHSSMSFLIHYGVKGMKWGVRRTQTQLDAASAEATRSMEIRGKVAANRGRTDSLSNKELQDAITRMNLEQQYTRLTAQPNNVERGQSYLKTGLSLGKSMNDVMSFINSPAGKLIRKTIIGV